MHIDNGYQQVILDCVLVLVGLILTNFNTARGLCACVCVRAYVHVCVCAFLFCDIFMLKVTALWSLVFVDSVQEYQS